MTISKEWIPCPLCNSENHQETMTTSVMMQNLAGEFTFVRCQDCQLVFLNPRVSLEELGIFYPDNYFPYRGEKAWGKYAPLASIGLKGMDQRRIRLVRKAYPIQAHTQVLDVGCGKPTFLKELQKKTECQAYGIDFNDRGWKGNPDFNSLKLHTCTVEELSDNQSFDLITMWHYLEHDYHPLSTLRKLRQVAKPHTRLIIEVPNYDSWSQRKQAAHWGGYHSPRHTVLYTPDTLQKMLHKSGWKSTRVQSHGTMDPFIVWWLGDMQKRNISWDESMEKYFPSMVFKKLLTAPFFALQRYISFGILLVIAQPDNF